MSRGRGGRNLGERAADMGVGPRVPRPPLADPAPRSAVTGHPAAGDGGEGRHCWVRDPPDAPGTWPGLLVEWRQRDGVWHGRVAYTVPRPQGPVLVEAWLPASRLEPR